MSNEKELNENERWKLLVLRLKEEADKKKITQEEIARKTGLIQSNISRFFSLKYCPNMSTFILISKALGITLKMENEKI
ncbi:MAG: helix-turn-helix transcriptional regulator [Flavobacteriaceae bacterium]|nr:helix-turn-helix transcriptional regulator [Flavobacteriaceae bacterium]